MVEISSSQDSMDAVALWRSLRDYLSVEVEVDVAGQPDANASVTVKFTVTNTAPSGPDWPEIEFEDVRVWIPGPGGRGAGPDNGILASGQSFTYELICDFRDLPALDPQITGIVSRRKFFQVRQAAEVPTAYTKPTVLAYLRAFNDIGVHIVLHSKIKSISIPGPDTPFAQLQAIIATLTTAVSEVEDTRHRLTDVAMTGSGEWVSAHITTVFEYLNEMHKACDGLRDAISAASSEEIASTARAMDALESEAASVNRATEELMPTYDISDEEVNYRYRGRTAEPSRQNPRS